MFLFRFIIVVFLVITTQSYAQSHLPFNTPELYYKFTEDEVEGFEVVTIQGDPSTKIKDLEALSTKDKINVLETIIKEDKHHTVYKKVINKAGNKNGITKTYWENGSLQQEVPYKNGNIHGVKKYFSKTGNLLAITPYVNGKREGNRILYFERYSNENEKIYSVIPYKNDQISGVIKTYKKESNTYFLRYKAVFKAGVPEGSWSTYDICYKPYPGDSTDRYEIKTTCLIETEQFAKGKKEGRSIEFDRDSSVTSITMFTAGKKAYKEYYYKGKKLYTNEYKDGKESGVHRSYYDNGNLRWETSFANGKRHGKQTWYHTTGTIETISNYDSGNQVGTVVEYYENGKKKHEYISTPSGKKTGIEQYYFEDGLLREENQYSDQGEHLFQTNYRRETGIKSGYTVLEQGRPKSYTYFDKDGKAIWTNNYNRGKVTGLYKHYDWNEKLEKVSFMEAGDGYTIDMYNDRIIKEEYTLQNKVVTKEAFNAVYEIKNDIPVKK